MKTRFDASTDVAMIGAWDVARGSQPFSADEYKQLSEALDADAEQGHLFVVQTGAGAGGSVDVYVDEAIPDEITARLTPVGEPCALALPTGNLIVDGVEHYRARNPDSSQADRAMLVTSGDYILRCYAPKEEEQAATPRSERDLEAAIGKEDLRYYERTTRAGCLTGILLLLLFPALRPLLGWKIAFAATVVTVVAYFIVRERVLRRNTRFARLRKSISAFRVQYREPTFVLELRRTAGDEGRATV